MTEATKDINKGDLVLVQPMRYCITFTEGGLENLNTPTTAPQKITHHWTEDGFKAKVLETAEHEIDADGAKDVEEYVRVKIFGQGRKHFTKRNNEKTKEVWIQSRLVSKCRDEGKKKKKKK
jgi:hypothetical protein